MPANTPAPGADPNATAAATVRGLAYVRGITAEDLAAACGIGRTTMFARLNGKSPWKLNEIVTVAEYLDVPLESLITGEVSLVPPSQR